MHLLPSAVPLLLLGQLTLAAPLLTPRLLPVADRFTCEIAGLQIDDPMRVLAALQRGASQPPSDLSTDEYTQLLLGCISASASRSRPHTNNFADPSGDQEDAGNPDPAAFGNSPGYPTTSNVSTGGPSTPDANPAGGPSTSPAPAAATDNSQAASPGASDASGDANGDSSASAAANGDSTAPAAANNDPPSTDNSATTPSTSQSDADANVNTSDATSAQANADPAPPSNSPVDPPAAADPPSDSPAASDSGSSPAPAATADQSAPSGSASNPNQATTANNASGGDNGSSDPASGSAAAADADTSGANAPSSAFSPFSGYSEDSAQDYTNGDGSEFDKPRQHSTSHTSNTCEGTLCLADTVLPAGVAEAPQLGTNGLASGNPKSCPTGDIDLCFDLGTR